MDDTASPAIQWYPGHIAKYERELKDTLHLLDVVVEVLDARLPHSSQHPRLSEWWRGNKPTLIVLNKSDLADPKVTQRWQQCFQQQGFTVVTLNSQSGKGVKAVLSAVITLAEGQMKKLEAKGLKRRPVRTGIVGMPNVGKSTLINALVGKPKTKTGHRAGVTRQLQWVSVHPQVQLLDTPGMVPPKFDDQDTAQKLACAYGLGDKAFDEEQVATQFLSWVQHAYPNRFETHYDVGDTLTLDAIAQARGYILGKGELDIKRTAQAILKDFRLGRLGGISLEQPQ